jgi:hypothetical protein
MINGWLPDCGACTPKGYKEETVRYRETVIVAMASRDFLTLRSRGGSGVLFVFVTRPSSELLSQNHTRIIAF